MGKWSVFDLQPQNGMLVVPGMSVLPAWAKVSTGSTGRSFHRLGCVLTVLTFSSVEWDFLVRRITMILWIECTFFQLAKIAFSRSRDKDRRASRAARKDVWSDLPKFGRRGVLIRGEAERRILVCSLGNSPWERLRNLTDSGSAEHVLRILRFHRFMRKVCFMFFMLLLAEFSCFLPKV